MESLNCTYINGRSQFLDRLKEIDKFLTLNEFAKKKKLNEKYLDKFEEILEYDRSELIAFACFHNISSDGYQILFEEYNKDVICYRTNLWDILHRRSEEGSMIILYHLHSHRCYLILAHQELSDFLERNEDFVEVEDLLPEKKYLLDLIVD